MREDYLRAMKLAEADGNIAAVNELAAELDAMQSETSIVDRYLGKMQDYAVDVGTTYFQGKQNAQQNYADLAKSDAEIDTVSPLTGPLMAASRGIRFMGDSIAGDAKTAWTAFVPEFVEKGIIKGGQKAVELLKKTPGAEFIADFAKDQFDEYLFWKEQNPEEARTFESLVDVGSLITPSKKVPSSQLSKTGKKIKISGIRKAQAERQKNIRSLLEPDVTDKTARQFTEQGVLKQRTWTPPEYQQEVVDAFDILDSIDPEQSYLFNLKQADAEVSRLAKQVEVDIRRAGNPKIGTSSVVKELGADLTEGLNDTNAVFIQGDARKMAQTLGEQALQFVRESDGTAVGILKARRKYDQWVQRQKPGVYNADTESAVSYINKIVRDSLNETVQRAVPKAETYHSLRQQHLLLRGGDQLASRVGEEAEHAFKRFYENLSSTLHLPKTALSLYVLGVAAMPFAPAIGTGVVAGATGYAAWKNLTNGQLRKAVGEILKQTDAAIKSSNDSVLINQLKADRQVLLSLYREEQKQREDE